MTQQPAPQPTSSPYFPVAGDLIADTINKIDGVITYQPIYLEEVTDYCEIELLEVAWTLREAVFDYIEFDGADDDYAYFWWGGAGFSGRIQINLPNGFVNDDLPEYYKDSFISEAVTI